MTKEGRSEGVRNKVPDEDPVGWNPISLIESLSGSSIPLTRTFF